HPGRGHRRQRHHAVAADPDAAGARTQVARNLYSLAQAHRGAPGPRAEVGGVRRAERVPDRLRSGPFRRLPQPAVHREPVAPPLGRAAQGHETMAEAPNPPKGPRLSRVTRAVSFWLLLGVMSILLVQMTSAG